MPATVGGPRPDLTVVRPGLEAATLPRGWLAVNLLGPRDTWAGTEGMTFHARAEEEALLDGLDEVVFEETDEDGTASSGPKHWHVFDVVARRPA